MARVLMSVICAPYRSRDLQRRSGRIKGEAMTVKDEKGLAALSINRAVFRHRKTMRLRSHQQEGRQ